MSKRPALVFLIALTLLSVPAAQSHAGQADEVLLGFVFGTATGLVFAGAISIFYTNPDSDRNLETYLIVGGLTGAAAGIVFGTLLPDNATERDPVVSMKRGDEWNASLRLPTLSLAPIQTEAGCRAGLYAELFHLDF